MVHFADNNPSDNGCSVWRRLRIEATSCWSKDCKRAVFVSASQKTDGGEYGSDTFPAFDCRVPREECVSCWSVTAQRKRVRLCYIQTCLLWDTRGGGGCLSLRSNHTDSGLLHPHFSVLKLVKLLACSVFFTHPAQILWSEINWCFPAALKFNSSPNNLPLALWKRFSTSFLSCREELTAWLVTFHAPDELKLFFGSIQEDDVVP